MTTYKELADDLFNKIKSYDFYEMTDEESYDIVLTYLRPAIVSFDDCTQDLSNRAEELCQFNFTLNDNNRVLLVNYMIIEWITSEFIYTNQTIITAIGSSDFKKFGTKDTLTKAMEVKDKLKEETDLLAIKKGYAQSSLYDLIKKKNGRR